MAYVYRHIRLDKNQPFYIGIGNVSNYQRAYTTQGRNKIWYDIVSKTEYEVEILFDDLTWDEACLKEIEFIALYGRIADHNGTLANLTTGGDGLRGMTDYTRRKISASRRGKKMSPEHLQKMRQTKFGNNNRGIQVVNHNLEISVPSAAFLARNIGVSRATVWVWLSGKIKPPEWFDWEYKY